MVRRNINNLAVKYAVSAVITLLVTNGCFAFFFAPLPPLDSRTPEPSLIPVERQAVVNTDLVPPLPDGPLPPNEVPPGHYVPEPTTGLTALIGLAAAGLLQRHRKRTSAV